MLQRWLGDMLGKHTRSSLSTGAARQTLKEQAEAVLQRAHLLSTGDGHQYDALIHHIRGAKVVLIGEASHGTHEFYAERAALTRLLIEKHGFTAVAVEGDWPDCYRINRWVRGHGDDETPEQALADFERFPRWMWRNTVVRDFISYLRDRNLGKPFRDQVGFYGTSVGRGKRRGEPSSALHGNARFQPCLTRSRVVR